MPVSLYLPRRFRSGPAMRPGESEFPWLWNKLVFDFDGAVQGRGMNARDLSGYQNHGTLNGSMTNDDWIVGPRGHGLDLDGADDHISISDAASIRNLPNAAWSVVLAWDQSLISGFAKQILTKADSSAVGWKVYSDQSNRFRILLECATTDMDLMSAANSVPDISYVQGVIIGTSGGVAASADYQIWINGSQITSFATNVSGVGAYNGDSTEPLRVCRSEFTSYTATRIYGLQLYSRALQPSEIRALYQGASPHTPRVRARWKAGAGTALTLNVSDTITLGESRTHTYGKPLVEALTLAETLAKQAGKPLADTVTLADAKALLAGLGKAETLAISDTLAKLAGKPLVDTLGLADQASAFLIIILALSETLNLGDALAKQAGLGKADSLGVSDQAAKMLAKQFADALGLGDLSDAQIVVLNAIANIILSRRGVPAKSSFTIAPAESQFSVQ